MLGLKLNHVSKRGPWSEHEVAKEIQNDNKIVFIENRVTICWECSDFLGTVFI